MGGWQDGWIGGRRDGKTKGFIKTKSLKGGVKGPLLMKPKKRGENLLRNLHRRRKIFFKFIM